MKVLLTGGSGFVGRHVLHAMQQQGVPAVLAGRTRPAALGTAQFIAVDLLDTTSHDELVQAAQATHLLHLAWVTGHGVYWNSPLNLRWLDATVQLVRSFCAAGGTHVVAAGSCAEYDWNQHGVCEEGLTPLRPDTVYGVAKDATRLQIEALCAQHGVRCAWARIFFPFGEGEDVRRLVPSVVRALRGEIEPFGVNAHTQRDFLPVQDLASALLTLLQTPAAGSYNLCSGVPTRIGDLVGMLAQSIGVDASTVLGLTSSRAPGPDLLAGDNSRLRALGWNMQGTLTNALARAVRALPVQTI